MFVKSGSRILLLHTPSLASRNEIFKKITSQSKTNTLLIGGSRIGKSTFKHILDDLTQTSSSFKSSPQTEFPLLEQYSVPRTDIILNIIDTSDLFQQTKTSSPFPDIATIMQLIDSYIRSKITQLHFVCSCILLETKVNIYDLHIVHKLL
ncbi:unnamed protein product [Rotaria sordida]|uniref:Uncharacterized protein n=1 Tax=Rotaria sordida TaxID=392033 RepID=A0A818Z3K7_9BILA|nr:unnamed protein product [Rotaria sordida]CAF3764370.1 unnamed protein product [Rotaria sordida]